MRTLLGSRSERLGQLVYTFLSPAEAMKAKTFWVGGLLLFALLSLVDLCLTWLVIDQGNGLVYEGNPIANAWLTRFGWQGLVVFKMLAILVVISSVLVISRQHPTKAAGVVLFSCVALSMVAYHSRNLLEHPPRAEDQVEELKAYEGRGHPPRHFELP